MGCSADEGVDAGLLDCEVYSDSPQNCVCHLAEDASHHLTVDFFSMIGKSVQRVFGVHEVGVDLYPC